MRSSFPSWEEGFRQIAAEFNNREKTGSVTLTANSATTTLTDPRIGINSAVLLIPTTANAAAEAPYIAVTAGSCTINHANNAQTDRTFRYAIVG